jgi:hypothetical protein
MLRIPHCLDNRLIDGGKVFHVGEFINFNDDINLENRITLARTQAPTFAFCCVCVVLCRSRLCDVLISRSKQFYQHSVSSTVCKLILKKEMVAGFSLSKGEKAMYRSRNGSRMRVLSLQSTPLFPSCLLSHRNISQELLLGCRPLLLYELHLGLMN